MTSLPTLMAALHSDDPSARQQAALQLGTQPTDDVLAELVALMAAESDDFVRETLTWVVVGSPQAAVEPLVAALRRDDLPHEPVLHALSKVGDPSSVAAIIPHADDPDPVVAAKAWWALGRIAAPEGLPALLAHLGAERAELRHALTRALLQFGGGALDGLAAELDSDQPARRSHAAEVLVAFADPTRYGIVERRTGQDHSQRAAELLQEATAPEVDGALLLATVSDDRPGLSEAAGRLRDQRR